MARFVLRLSLALALLAVGTPDSTAQPNLFMLSVGVDSYQAPTNKLMGCVNDATGLAKIFGEQTGKNFSRVEVKLLADAQARLAPIAAEMRALEGKGGAGDWCVLVLSGHGGIERDKWGFLTQDNKMLTDDAILGMADRAAAAGKTVLIIIDACHAGHLRYAAGPVLNRHAEAGKGGIVLMVSSMPDQLSAALTAFSAFAQAVERGLKGNADFDGDGAVSLKELRRFTYNEVYELQRRKRLFPGLGVRAQDCAIDASLSIPETLPLVRAKRPAAPPAVDDGPVVSMPGLVGREWRVNLPATKFAPPTIFQLKLEPSGVYRAAVKEGLRPASMSDGTYRIHAKAIELIHHQGTDRLQIVSLAPDNFHFRFQDREFIAVTDPALAAAIVVDTSGRLSPEDPRDRVRRGAPHKVHVVKLDAGVNYVIDLESSEFDSYLRLEDAAGNQLAEDDDSGGERNARIRFTPRAAGEYRVIATAYSGEGIYHLRIQRSGGPRAPDRTLAADTLLNVNDELKAGDPMDSVRTGSFARSYKAKLKRGVTYRIDLTSTDFDTYLRVEDEAGKQLAEDDDGGDNTNARLDFTAPHDGVYRLIATSFRNATGRFHLTVKGPGTAPSGGGTALALKGGAGRVADSLAATDKLDRVRKGSRAKVYLLQLEAGATYTINLKSGDFDAYLRLEDATGRELAHDDDGGGGHDARLVFAPTATATYRLIVTSFNDAETGAFTLTIER
ncbi:MAG: caspase family protein [Gemmataceae bacterium]